MLCCHVCTDWELTLSFSPLDPGLPQPRTLRPQLTLRPRSTARTL